MILHMIRPKQRCYRIGQTDEQSLQQFRPMVASFTTPQERSLTIGTVTRIENGRVWIDIKAKDEGVLSEEEFLLREFGQKIMVGDRVQVWVQDASSVVDSHDGTAEYSSISFSKAAQIRSWPELEKIYHSRQLISGIVLAKVPGGYVVAFPSNGGRGFLPLSQADPAMARSPEILQRYKTEQHPYMIIRMERNWYVVLSRRELMSEGSSVPETSKTPNERHKRARRSRDS